MTHMQPYPRSFISNREGRVPAALLKAAGSMNGKAAILATLAVAGNLPLHEPVVQNGPFNHG